ncbi:hypothetical protein [Sphingomonas sp.]|uniref:hypothetical protein n=1 Tax=Sphingomonas sp. TaxID=28214 RepID=UPI002FCA9E22
MHSASELNFEGGTSGISTRGSDKFECEAQNLFILEMVRIRYSSSMTVPQTRTLLSRVALLAATAIILLTEPAARTAIAAPASFVRDPSAWVIGPLVRGRNYSVGMPLHPTAGRNGTWQIDLPRHPGSVHYVTFPHGSLQGKTRIVMRYRLEAAPGVRVHASTAPGSPGIITPYFQRYGDNWTARGRFEAFRWYGTFATQEITPGEHMIVAPLNANWTAVERSSAQGSPAAFREALADADQVGFVLGGGDGAGHGVYATGPARLVVTQFSVE